ncbi:hypothetical protein ACFFJB_05410 [Camelimonas abortus]|uniref:PhiE125 gp8 family phage protein n=1 Tax=Camelimonas abortus TaxID=1017184 RepID=A0ABV7LHH1_9HYPH
MKLTPVNGPATEPVSAGEMKRYLRLTGDDEDGTLAAMTSGARAVIEAAAGLALISQRWRIILDSWPACGLLRAPLRPLQEIVCLQLRDAAGAAHPLDPAVARIEPGLDAIRLDPAAAPPPGGLLEIEVVAGYGPDAGDVPEPLRLAIRVLVAA